MPNPAPTTEHFGFNPESELTDFFYDRSVVALEQSIGHVRDASFYKSVGTKLADGIDLSNDLPELLENEARKSAPAIIASLQKEAETGSYQCWELKSGPAKVFSTSVRTHTTEDSNIPCFDVEYASKTDHGRVKVNVKTWRRNVEITVTGTHAAMEDAHKRLVMSAFY